MLEEKGIVGPADGAKPREVYGEQKPGDSIENIGNGSGDEADAADEETNPIDQSRDKSQEST